MSLSQTQDTKSYIANVTAAGEAVEIATDAVEDREIVGVSITYGSSLGEDINAHTDVYVGTSPFPGADEDTDNEGFFIRGELTKNDAEGMVHQNDPDLWFGDGSGFDWNEDATLTVKLSENVGNTVNCAVTVYYREV